MNDILRYENIQKRIITLRGTEIILDRDLSVMYEVETRVLKQAVRRNINRFPAEFMFELTEEEINSMVSQTVIPSKSYFGGSTPYAFTEQGVAMVSSVLNSPTAIQVSIQIMKAFVFVRSVLNANYNINIQFNKLEKKQDEFEINTNSRFNEIFNAISSKQLTPNEGIFYDGQIFDAYAFVAGLIKKADKSIVLIDNYIDESVLLLLSKRKPGVKTVIYTHEYNKQQQLDVKKFNQQYPEIIIKQFSKSHDRFLIIDNTTIYHIGASLKDLGKKWFAFSVINFNADELINRLELPER